MRHSSIDCVAIVAVKRLSYYFRWKRYLFSIHFISASKTNTAFENRLELWYICSYPSVEFAFSSEVVRELIVLQKIRGAVLIECIVIFTFSCFVSHIIFPFVCGIFLDKDIFSVIHVTIC